MSESESSSLDTVEIVKNESEVSLPDNSISLPQEHQPSPLSQITGTNGSPLNYIPEFTSTNKPAWATGDPFFDTMAGLDSPVYRQYYVDTSSETNQSLDNAAATMSIADSQSSGKDMTYAPSENNDIGLDHWNRTREKWTQGRWHVVPSENSNNPALSAIHPGNHDAIYDSLVYDHKRLSKPIPLPLVIKVLVSGWKRDGFWPETPTQPGTTASSTPALNAYTPGFSSTNSQPVARKS